MIGVKAEFFVMSRKDLMQGQGLRNIFLLMGAGCLLSYLVFTLSRNEVVTRVLLTMVPFSSEPTLSPRLTLSRMEQTDAPPRLSCWEQLYVSVHYEKSNRTTN